MRTVLFLLFIYLCITGTIIITTICRATVTGKLPQLEDQWSLILVVLFGAGSYLALGGCSKHLYVCNEIIITADGDISLLKSPSAPQHMKTYQTERNHADLKCERYLSHSARYTDTSVGNLGSRSAGPTLCWFLLAASAGHSAPGGGKNWTPA